MFEDELEDSIVSREESGSLWLSVWIPSKWLLVVRYCDIGQRTFEERVELISQRTSRSASRSRRARGVHVVSLSLGLRLGFKSEWQIGPAGRT